MTLLRAVHRTMEKTRLQQVSERKGGEQVEVSADALPLRWRKKDVSAGEDECVYALLFSLFFRCQIFECVHVDGEAERKGLSCGWVMGEVGILRWALAERLP